MAGRWPDEPAWLLVGLAGALLFGAVAEDVLEHGPEEELVHLDSAAAHVAQQVGGASRAVLGDVSWLGSVAVMAPLFTAIVVLLWWRGRRHAAWRVAVLVLVLQTVVAAAKLLVARPRPADAGLLELAGSFPSGHTATAALLACVVVWLIRRGHRHRATLGLVAVGLAWVLLIGVSRLALGVHYLTDILAGFGLGLAVGGLGLALPEAWFTRSPRTPRSARARPARASP
ncbi:MAG: phosphatase PAP2 family protein [Halobacteriales archaeon]|nr:phosphatase PAP2 family protein [Halobacteriales archaeon]